MSSRHCRDRLLLHSRHFTLNSDFRSFFSLFDENLLWKLFQHKIAVFNEFFLESWKIMLNCLCLIFRKKIWMPLVTQKKWGSCFCISIRTPGIVCANSSTIIFWLSEAYNRNIEYKEIFDRMFSLRLGCCASVSRRRGFAFGGVGWVCAQFAQEKHGWGEKHTKHENIYYERAAILLWKRRKKNTAREDYSKKNTTRRREKKRYTKKLQLSATDENERL